MLRPVKLITNTLLLAILLASPLAPHGASAQAPEATAADPDVEPTGDEATEPAETASRDERDEEARNLFEAGRRAFTDGRFQEALQYITRAHELSGRDVLLFNMASALDRMGRLEEARAQYLEYLEIVPDADNRSFVESRLAVVNELIAQRVSTEPEEESGPESEPELVEPEVSPAEGPSGRSLIGPITLIGVGVLSAGIGIATGLSANSIYSDLEADCPGGACSAALRDDADRMDRLALTTDVLFGLAGGLALAGLLWWVLGGDGASDSATATALCTGTGCTAGARIQF